MSGTAHKFVEILFSFAALVACASSSIDNPPRNAGVAPAAGSAAKPPRDLTAASANFASGFVQGAPTARSPSSDKAMSRPVAGATIAAKRGADAEASKRDKWRPQHSANAGSPPPIATGLDSAFRSQASGSTMANGRNKITDNAKTGTDDKPIASTSGKANGSGEASAGSKTNGKTNIWSERDPSLKVNTSNNPSKVEASNSANPNLGPVTNSGPVPNPGPKPNPGPVPKEHKVEAATKIAPSTNASNHVSVASTSPHRMDDERAATGSQATQTAGKPAPGARNANAKPGGSTHLAPGNLGTPIFAAANPRAMKPDSDVSAFTGIVFESYDVSRPDAAKLSVGAFREEILKLGYVATPNDVMTELGNQSARPAIASAKFTPKQLRETLQNARAQWNSAIELSKLEEKLSSAVATAFDNPALVVTDQTIKTSLQNALLALALVNGKLARAPNPGQDARRFQKISEDMMAEWIRTFRGTEITQKVHGPEAEKLYTRVLDGYGLSGRGILEVVVDDSNVQLYVNEEIRSLIHPIPDLLPGNYRVLLMGPNDDAKLFKINVQPNRIIRLTIQWGVSSNLVASTSYVAFVFPLAMHPDPGVLACQLARKTAHVNDGVVLVGMELEGKKWKVTASLRDLRDCSLLRSGFVTLGNKPTPQEPAALARFIARGKHDPAVTVTREAAPALIEKIATDRLAREAERAKPPAPPPPPPQRSRALGWIALGGAATMLAVGGYGMSTKEQALGVGALGVGALLGVLAAYSFSGDDSSTSESTASTSTATIAPLHGGAMVGWAGRF